MTVIRVLFLDIDGVINSTRSSVAYGGYPHDLTPLDLPMFDLVALGLIRALCERGKLSVVISSAWRATHGWDAIGRALDLPTIGQTPNTIYSRGREIAMWLDRHPDVTEYAIVDDMPDMLTEQLPVFVQTCGFEGLSWLNYTRLCEIFGVEAYGTEPVRERTGSTVRLAWE